MCTPNTVGTVSSLATITRSPEKTPRPIKTQILQRSSTPSPHPISPECSFTLISRRLLLVHLCIPLVDDDSRSLSLLLLGLDDELRIRGGSVLPGLELAVNSVSLRILVPGLWTTPRHSTPPGLVCATPCARENEPAQEPGPPARWLTPECPFCPAKVTEIARMLPRFIGPADRRTAVDAHLSIPPSCPSVPFSTSTSYSHADDGALLSSDAL